MIRGQRFVDNELLGRIERNADAVTVVTTTLEFDVGDLRHPVLQNLQKGKEYTYYIPYLEQGGITFPS